jgi:hypothetical protein
LTSQQTILCTVRRETGPEWHLVTQTPNHMCHRVVAALLATRAHHHRAAVDARHCHLHRRQSTHQPAASAAAAPAACIGLSQRHPLQARGLLWRTDTAAARRSRHCHCCYQAHTIASHAHTSAAKNHTNATPHHTTSHVTHTSDELRNVHGHLIDLRTAWGECACVCWGGGGGGGAAHGVSDTHCVVDTGLAHASRTHASSASHARSAAHAPLIDARRVTCRTAQCRAGS